MEALSYASLKSAHVLYQKFIRNFYQKFLNLY